MLLKSIFFPIWHNGTITMPRMIVKTIEYFAVCVIWRSAISPIVVKIFKIGKSQRQTSSRRIMCTARRCLLNNLFAK